MTKYVDIQRKLSLNPCPISVHTYPKKSSLHRRLPILRSGWFEKLPGAKALANDHLPLDLALLITRLSIESWV